MVNLLEQNIKCEKNEQQRFVKLQINLCLYSFDVKAHTIDDPVQDFTCQVLHSTWLCLYPLISAYLHVMECVC